MNEERRKADRRKEDQRPRRDLAQYAHITSAISLAFVVFILIFGYLENREREAEVRALTLHTQAVAAEESRENCRASERVAEALRRLIQVTIDTRRELQDLDAAVFEERYLMVLDLYLKPREC